MILQFSDNDVRDNLNNKVTIVESDKFAFQESKSTVNWLKKYLSHSIIQKSQFYNLFRDSVYRIFEQGIVAQETQGVQAGQAVADGISANQEFYTGLFKLFVDDLNSKGIKILMISVDGHLERLPYINNMVMELQRNNILRYVEVRDWLDDEIDYRSPEGHAWGDKAHEIIGEQLSRIVKRIN